MIEITYPFACSQTVRYASGSFIEFMKQEMGMLNVRFSTKKNHLSTWKLLVSYRQEITFDDLNYAFICDFEQYLLQRNYCINTIGKHMRQLKRYINLAINRGLMDFRSYPFRRYKIKTTPTKRMFLTPEELKEMAKYQAEFATAAFKQHAGEFMEEAGKAMEKAGKAVDKAGAVLDGTLEGLFEDEKMEDR